MNHFSFHLSTHREMDGAEGDQRGDAHRDEDCQKGPTLERSIGLGTTLRFSSAGWGFQDADGHSYSGIDWKTEEL